MRAVDIRRSFLDYFTDRGHRPVPSSSLVSDDPTLLLTTAGMVQFKPYFLGRATPPARRLTSLQKCVRTVDIENIGRTDRHATFFEMAGNFSFGDYGKAEVLPWAFELLTDRLGLDPGRLWATVYLDDDETAALWQKVGIPAERIQRLGMADNYWSTGGPGPCGPDSELFYDRGPRFGRGGGPAVDTDRYLEVWNLVFMRYVRGEGGTDDDFPIVGELPQPCIESGLGVERVAVVLQGVENIHQIDVFSPVLDRLAEIADDERLRLGRGMSERVVVDHVRAAAFLVADGVLPSNEGRGYVLRRLLRRAVRHARLLGVDGPLLPDLACRVVESLGEAWPELVEHQSLIDQALAYEEEVFGRTLRQGSRLLDVAIGRTREGRASVLPGGTAFELHDTYGFPLDLTVEIAQEAGLSVDTDRFGTLMDEQRRRGQEARVASAGPEQARDDVYRRLAERFGPTSFVGYDDLVADGTVLTLLDDRGGELPVVAEGERARLILDRTPCYAEAGGQVGDRGTVRSTDGTELQVVDTRPGRDGLYVHTVEVVRGELRVGAEVETTVDGARRTATARSHSATHVLHALLRRSLGDHARQHGSLVAPGRLRFDFTHFAALDPGRLEGLESAVNRELLGDPDVRVWQASRSEAQAAGAMALFGETYGDLVRIVDIGDVSRELCGGTHVGHGSQAGMVRLLGESSVGSGVRRIEALTGLDALEHADHERRLLEEVRALLGVGRTDETVERLRQRLTALADAERALDEHRQRERATVAARLAGGREPAGSGWLVVQRLDDGSDPRALADDVLARCPSGRPGAVVLGTVRDGKAQIVLRLARQLVDRGVSARDLLGEAGRTIGGGAGGHGPVAVAGGRNVDRLDTALDQVRHAVRQVLAPDTRRGTP